MKINAVLCGSRWCPWNLPSSITTIGITSCSREANYLQCTPQRRWDIKMKTMNNPRWPSLRHWKFHAISANTVSQVWPAAQAAASCVYSTKIKKLICRVEPRANADLHENTSAVLDHLRFTATQATPSHHHGWMNPAAGNQLMFNTFRNVDGIKK